MMMIMDRRMLHQRKHPSRRIALLFFSLVLAMGLERLGQAATCRCSAFVVTTNIDQQRLIATRRHPSQSLIHEYRHHRNNRRHDSTAAGEMSSSSLLVLEAKKKKRKGGGGGGGGGMAAKRARRQAKQQQQAPSTDHMPKANLNLFGDDDDDKDEANASAASTAVAEDEEKRATMTRAEELLERQRDSVAMLTRVREAVEGLPVLEMMAALESDGFYVCDNLLTGSSTGKDDNDTTTRSSSDGLIDQMQKEALALLETSGSQQDVNYLASGEYICNLQGGEEQYKISPRSIEWVVSVTKHLPEHKNIMGESELDAQKCIGLMRTFDRKARVAARKLLAPKDADSSSSEEEDELAPRAFGLSATEGVDDLKQLSMRYYLVPSDWVSLRHGGGLAFQKEAEAEAVHVDAVRDRLVMWKSHETLYQSKPWFGDDSEQYESASCIELHLVRKA